MRGKDKKIIGIAVAVFIVIAAVIGTRYFYSEYHTYYSPTNREYEETLTVNSPYVLKTQKKVLLGKSYASFFVESEESKETLYQCPDLYLIKELKEISWDEGGRDILVALADGKTVRYRFDRNTWAK